MPDTIAKPTVALGWLEMNIFGKWDRARFNELNSMIYFEWRTIAGKSVQILPGDKHGFDKYPFAVKNSQFRIDAFYHARYAARITLFPEYFAGPAPLVDLKPIIDYAKDLGLQWSSEQVSRIDLSADVRIPFDPFGRRIDNRWWVCRADRNRSEEMKDHATSRYIGNSQKILFRLYDKAEQLDKEKDLPVEGPLTRIEFQLRRRWLCRQGIHKWADVDLPALWKQLAAWFRFTNAKPDGTHQDRYKTWEVWEAIQSADWTGRRLLHKGYRRPIRPIRIVP